MPRNTGVGVIQSGLALLLGFAMVWYMWWLALLAFVALVVVTVAHTFNYNRDYYIPADEVARIEGARPPHSRPSPPPTSDRPISFQPAEA
jgi:cytochrome o ubiquinol oxidase subunit 1